MTNSERFVHGIADFGNLFFVLTWSEMRKQGISYLALYVLQRAIGVKNAGFRGLPESELRDETGLPDYEVSRACRLLVNAGLLKATRLPNDKRNKTLVPTALGKRVFARIMSAAAQRLHDSTEEAGRFRRLQGGVEHLRKAREKLRGFMQLSFFEREFQRGKRPKVPVPRWRPLRPAQF
jgi:DNA-binding MarR family transcriptional regulator